MRIYMNNKFLIHCSVLFALSVPLSHGANWTAVSIKDDHSLYYDEESIKIVNGDTNLKQVWQKVIFRIDTENTRKNDYMLSLEYFNCEDGKRALKKLYIYNANRTLKYNFTHEKLKFEDIVPESFSEIVFKSVCLKA